MEDQNSLVKEEKDVGDESADRKTDQGWQPVGTAPKDGTPIIGFWRPAPGGEITAKCYAVTYHELGEWLNVDDSDDAYAEPTHWMPLPDPPKLRSKLKCAN